MATEEKCRNCIVGFVEDYDVDTTGWLVTEPAIEIDYKFNFCPKCGRRVTDRPDGYTVTSIPSKPGTV